MASTHISPIKIFCNSDDDGDLAEIHGGPAEFYGFEVANPTAVDLFLQIFDAAAADVILGTTPPSGSFLIPAGDGSLHGGNARDLPAPIGLNHGLSYAITTNPGGAILGSDDCVTNILYRHVTVVGA